MLRNLVTLAIIAAIALVDGTDASAVVHPRVHRALQQTGTVNLIVTMKQSTSRVLQEHDDSQDDGDEESDRRLMEQAGNSTSKWEIVRRGIRIKKLVDALQLHANTTQKAVDAVIAQNGTTAKPLFAKTRKFWMTNQLFFRNASQELVEKLSKLPGIKELREEQRFPLPQVLSADNNATAVDLPGVVRPLIDSGLPTTVDISSAQWGVKKIGATTAWGNGTIGQGITLGLIDTGVLATHETLAANFRGAANYGWFDPEKKASEPYDPQGHGTAVTSLAVGSKGIGVAPGATWIMCKNCRDEDCPESDVLSCLQWMLCPTDVNGENADCSKAPHIVNNSWGDSVVDWSYQAAIRAWVSAGIIPVFANGNTGPLCNTVNYPAGYPDVISVGASRSDDAVVSASSKGPSSDGTIKPDLIAPGYSVKSAWGDADDSYYTSQGTSLSAPHVSGAIALMLSANGNLTMPQIRSAITSTTVRKIAATLRVCGGTADSVIPNNQFGYGRLNVASALDVTKITNATTV